MRKYSVVLLFLVMLTISCNIQSNKNKSSIRGFDISQNDDRILFAFVNGGNSSINEMDINGNNHKTLIESKSDKFHINPRYSTDGQKIIFIEYDKADLYNNSLFIANSDGTNIQYLTGGDGIITEAIFSNYGEEILFCKANKYSKYSPIGVKAAHDYDIYSINLSNMEVVKLSNLKAYSLHHIFEMDSDNLLMHIFDSEKGGIGLFNKNEPDKFNKIVPLNNPRETVSELFNTPIYSEKFNKMAFIAPYQIYIMDMDSKNASLLYDNRGNTHIDYISFFKVKEKIMFVNKGDINFYYTDLNGKDLRKIAIPKSGNSSN